MFSWFFNLFRRRDGSYTPFHRRIGWRGRRELGRLKKRMAKLKAWANKESL